MHVPTPQTDPNPFSIQKQLPRNPKKHTFSPKSRLSMFDACPILHIYLLQDPVIVPDRCYWSTLITNRPVQSPERVVRDISMRLDMNAPSWRDPFRYTTKVAFWTHCCGTYRTAWIFRRTPVVVWVPLAKRRSVWIDAVAFRRHRRDDRGRSLELKGLVPTVTAPGCVPSWAPGSRRWSSR